RAAGARAEIADRQTGEFRLCVEPARRGDQPGREQRNVEAVLARQTIPAFLIGCQEVKKESADARALELARDVRIAGAESAASTPMREENDPVCRLGNAERTRQSGVPRRNPYFSRGLGKRAHDPSFDSILIGQTSGVKVHDKTAEGIGKNYTSDSRTRVGRRAVNA